MSTTKKLAALLGAGVLSIAMFGTAVAGVTVWATVDGYADGSAGNNDPAFWGDNCTKINAGEGDLGLEQGTYVLGADYGQVIVKSGSGEFANTIFNDVSAGETVWADTNGNGTYEAFEAGEGDQNISHIIFCDEVDETEPPATDEPTPTPEEPTPTPEFTDEGAGETDAPSEPNTATIGGNGTSGPADGAWLLVVALGVLLASVVVMTPARAKSRR
ncbi:MAG TPA: hypothetical protein VMQ65_08425 [Candidatus Limnocylindria bacterium]|nr:hypothetical protein [Candidatus Limnocylindria bacterium]